MVGDRVRRALEEQQHPTEQGGRAVRKSRLVHLRAEVVLVEDEALAEELERRGQRPDRCPAGCTPG